MHECRSCHEVKPAAEFGIRSDTKRRKTRCLKCDAAWHREYYANNSKICVDKAKTYYQNNKEKRRAYLANRVQKDRAWNRDYKLRQNYGISFDLVCETIEAQYFHCPICNDHLPTYGRHWHVDHCHKTRIVRGVICARCNLLLGKARDQIETLARAIEYLRKSDAAYNDTQQT
jgi:hypothetical protein